MDIAIAREVAIRIWCDQEMTKFKMDCELAETIAQLLSRLTLVTSDEEAQHRLERIQLCHLLAAFRNYPPRRVNRAVRRRKPCQNHLH